VAPPSRSSPSGRSADTSASASWSEVHRVCGIPVFRSLCAAEAGLSPSARPEVNDSLLHDSASSLSMAPPSGQTMQSPLHRLQWLVAVRRSASPMAPRTGRLDRRLARWDSGRGGGLDGGDEVGTYERCDAHDRPCGGTSFRWWGRSMADHLGNFPSDHRARSRTTSSLLAVMSLATI
jgi:hypothetical protein